MLKPRLLPSFLHSKTLFTRFFSSSTSQSSIREVTLDEEKTFFRDGYLFIRKLYDNEECKIMLDTIAQDDLIEKNAMPILDSKGMKSRITLWNHPNEDTYSYFATCRRQYNAISKLIQNVKREDIYHFHTKLMLKEPKVGGRWEWHQDFGYWYQIGCLNPEKMCSVMIAIDRHYLGNGCLKILKGSHVIGRLDHGVEGEQAGANAKRVEQALKRFEVIDCEMEAGDALFFHPNLLHSSEANYSNHWRRALITAWNTKDNEPYPNTICPMFTPLTPVDDNIIKLKGVSPHHSNRPDFLDHERNSKAFSGAR